MKALLVTTAASCVLLSGLSAQSSAPQSDAVAGDRVVHQLTTPIEHYVLHYASGTLHKVDELDASQVGTQSTSVVAYQNDCTTGSFVGAGNDELVDWGVKGAGLTGVVDTFDFAYATDAGDISAGGFGATVDIAFYEGTLGGGVLGTEVARYSFTGLPGSLGGGFSGFLITVDLSGGFEFCLSDGPIGFGYCSSDPGTTGPLITDIGTCPNGQDDAYDAWACPATTGTFNGTFFFGGSPTASFYMVVNEDDGSEIATTALNNGSGVNPILLDDGGVAPILGQVWPITIDTGAGGHAVSSALFYKGNFPPGTLIINAGEVIVDPTSPQDFVNTIAGTGINDHSVLVPKDVTLIGFDYTVQGLVYVGAPVQLTNALDIHIGF